jgi:protein-disulfide isomerase
LIPKVRQGMALASKYKASETPTIIINDVIKVTPRIAGGDVEKMTENLDLIISKLLSNK